MWPALILASSALIGNAAPPLGLAIANLAVSASDGGQPALRPFASGDHVFIRFDAPGATRTRPEDDADPRVKLTYRATLVDSFGVPLSKPLAGEVVAELAPEDKDWMPRVRLDFELPPSLVESTARLTVHLRDEVAGTEAEATANIQLAGPKVAPDAPFAGAGFGYYRKPDDAQPIAPAAYRPGDTVWARFDIVGFRRAEGNRYSVAYGLEALDAAGKSLYRQEVAAEEQGDSPYPRRYLPAALSLNLTPDLAPGTYRIRLLLNDRLAGTTATSEHPFTVE